jgi:hypothetical protein
VRSRCTINSDEQIGDELRAREFGRLMSSARTWDVGCESSGVLRRLLAQNVDDEQRGGCMSKELGGAQSDMAGVVVRLATDAERMAMSSSGQGATATTTRRSSSREVGDACVPFAEVRRHSATQHLARRREQQRRAE